MDTTYSFPAEFTVPAELKGLTPRRVLPTGSGIQMALAAAILLALAAAGVAWTGSPAARSAPQSQLAVLVAAAVAAALALMLFILLAIDYRMAAWGTPALAVVSECTQHKHGYFVRYRLRVGEESWIKGKGWCKSHIEPGNGIWIIHRPGKARRNLPYPLTYWRPIK